MTARKRVTYRTNKWGWQHQKTRKRLLASAVGSPCVRCGKPILSTSDAELDHFEGAFNQYRGFSHRYCNRRAGALHALSQVRDPEPKGQTRW
jgi:hypothetical protein